MDYEDKDKEEVDIEEEDNEDSRFKDENCRHHMALINGAKKIEIVRHELRLSRDKWKRHRSRRFCANSTHSILVTSKCEAARNFYIISKV